MPRLNKALVCDDYVSKTSGSGSPLASMNFEPFAVLFHTAKFSEFAFISATAECNVTASRTSPR